MGFTTLERQILQITGTTFGPGATIPTGTRVSAVTLTTIDEDTGPLGPLLLQFDPYALNTGERASLRIDGREVATLVPSAFVTQVTTDAGSFRALAFVADGNTYLIPRGTIDVGAATQFTASATVSTLPSSLFTPEYGLLPENADTFAGQIFIEQRFGALLTGASVSDHLLYDADGVRGNTDSVGEEIALQVSNGALFRAGEAQEIVATVQFTDGGVLALDAVRTTAAGSFGAFTASYLFDDAALAAAGREIADIAQVLSSATTDHDLDWEELGFTLVAAGEGSPTPDPEPEPPINFISGTARRDMLEGTAGRDILAGGAGRDTLTGGDGADAFLFGLETRDGRREVDRVTDYEVGVDIIAFADGVTVTKFRNIDGGVEIVFGPDQDRALVFGDEVTTATIRIFGEAFIPALL